VLRHGLGSSRDAWASVIPALAAHFDVMTAGSPGSGDSVLVTGQAELKPATWATAVAGLLDELGATTRTWPGFHSAASLGSAGGAIRVPGLY